MEQGLCRAGRAAKGGSRTAIHVVAGAQAYSGRRFVIVAVLAVLVIWGLLYSRLPRMAGAVPGAGRLRGYPGRAGDRPPRRGRPARRRPGRLARRRGPDACDAPDRHRLEPAGPRRDAGPPRRARPRRRPRAGPPGDGRRRAGRGLGRHVRARRVPPQGHPAPQGGPPSRAPRSSPPTAKDRVAPALDPLAGLDPPGVDLVQWRDAVARTRALLLDVTAARTISTLRMQDLRRELDRAVARARAHPESAVAELAAVWDALDRYAQAFSPDRKSESHGHARPEIFPPRRP